MLGQEQDMREQVSKALYDYWRALKGVRQAPERNDIEFGAIRGLLANVFILQVDPSGRFPMRLCGTRINALWLDEQKGRSFLEFWDARARGAVVAALATVTDESRPVVLRARSGSGDLPCLDVEVLLLPLRHFGAQSLVLGALAPVNDPDWIGRRPVRALHVQSLRVPGSAEMARDARISRRSHLHLVH
jgi:hypothetical protein